MSLNIPTQQLLSSGRKWFAYSGLQFGDASLPAVIPLVSIENVGLEDSVLVIKHYYGLPVSTASQQGLGIQIQIDDIIVYEFKGPDGFYRDLPQPINLFIPRQSKLDVLSLNTSGNNGQARGATVLGYFC